MQVKIANWAVENTNTSQGRKGCLSCMYPE